MLRVGLTGGTGSGKSTVAALLAARGAVVVDADALAREVVAAGTDGLAAVVEQFGEDVLAGDGSLDRAALGRLVFADARRRQALERITHPRIAARTRELVAAAPEDAVLVHDVPLLVEKAMGADYHLVVVVDAPEAERVRRLVRRGTPAADARTRIAAQADGAARRAAADVWLVNDAGTGALESAVAALWSRRLVPFEAHLRSGTPAPRPDPVPLRASDPTWPAQARRVLQRVRRAVGDAGLSLQHVGPTAVPGLPARDVLDLQLVVADRDTADALTGPLARAGLPRLRPEAGEASSAASGDGPMPGRLHASCDPCRAVDLWLRTLGDPLATGALRLRDLLRADAGERAASPVESRSGRTRG